MSGIVRTARALQYFNAPLRAFAAQPRLAATFSTSLARFKAYPPHVVIDMPALSPTMEMGNIGQWKKKVGDKLAPGEALVEVETDKASMDFEFQEDGYLAKILLEEGAKDVPIGTPVGVYVEDAKDVPAFADFTVEAAPQASQAPVEAAPAAPAAEAAKPASTSSNTSSSPSVSANGRIFASPRAKTIALEKGIKLSEVKGTGPNGRIIAKDVEAYKPAASAQAAAQPSASASASYEDIPVSQMRATIAKRLRQSKNEAPDFIVSSDISVSKLLQLRKSLNASANGLYKISVNDILVKAIALALRKVPAPNTHWIEDQKIMREHKSVDISVAVSTPKGLITPIVFDAQNKGLAEISASVKDLAKRARDNKLKPEEFQGGTITISNLGMNQAVKQFTAIINPPQSAIIGIGSVQRKAVEDPLQESGISFDDVMNITGTFDHRVVDGAVAGDFMRELKTILENPLKLLL